MKKLFVCLIVLVLSTTLSAQIDYEVKKYYGGILSENKFKTYLESPESKVNLMLGVETVFRYKFGLELDTYTITKYKYAQEGKEIFGKYFCALKKYFGNFVLHTGVFPRPIRILTTPHPISQGAQFIPPSIDVITGTAPTIMVKHTVDNLESFLGTYFTSQDKLDYNLGFRLCDWWLFKKISASGYVTNYLNYRGETGFGAAINGQVGNLKLTAFYANHLLKEGLTRSCLAEYEFYKETSAYLSTLNENDKWIQIELGLTTTLKGGEETLNLSSLIGFGYSYSEIQSNTFNLYFNIWKEK